jgi:hypothetical protein
MSQPLVANLEITKFIWSRIGTYPPTSYSVGWLGADGTPIGGYIIDRYTGKGGSCWSHMAGKPGWLSRHKLHAFARHVFDHLKCSVVYGVVDVGDRDVIEIDKKLGFRELVVLKGHFAGGVDALLLELRPETCRWIAARPAAAT